MLSPTLAKTAVAVAILQRIEHGGKVNTPPPFVVSVVFEPTSIHVVPSSARNCSFTVPPPNVCLVPHVGYRSADARPPSGIPLWAPVTHYSQTYDKALLGCRYHDPNYTTHTGSDFPANEGNSVHTTMAGQVVWASFNGPWGNLVAVENGDYQTWFAHLSRIDVVVGQLVNDGDVVGLVGTTGHSTGNHVHYGVKVFANDTDAFGSWHNPEEFFSLNDVILIGCG